MKPWDPHEARLARESECLIAALCLGDPENPVIAGVKYFDLLAILDRPSPGPEMPPSVPTL